MKRLLTTTVAIAAALAVPAMAGAQTNAEITLVHGIPGATVDVAAGGEVVVPNFEPGTVQDISALAGQTLTDLEVRAAGTEDVVIGPIASFDVPAEGSYSVVAHLDADGNPTITPFENDTTPVPEGTARLTIRHTAAAPAVDVVLGDARPVENAANGDSVDLDLPAGEISGAQIAPTGGDPIADVPTVELQAGTNLIVYAVGSLEDGTFTFYTEERPLQVEGAAGGGDGTPAPTAVNTGGAMDSSGVDPMVLFAAAGALFLVSGGAAVAFRRARVDR